MQLVNLCTILVILVIGAHMASIIVVINLAEVVAIFCISTISSVAPTLVILNLTVEQYDVLKNKFKQIQNKSSMEIHELKRVRLSNSNNANIDPDYLYTIPEWENLREYDERVILNSHNYEIIFHKRYSDDDYKSSKRGIVKIQCGDKIIYRFFCAKGIDVDTAGLTQLSILQLGINEGPFLLHHSRAKIFGKFLFYYNHPFHEVRVPLKIAFFFGIISIIYGCLS